MPDFVISYVEADHAWADWVAWEVERGDGRVAMHRADRRGWSGIGTEDYGGAIQIPVLSPAYQRYVQSAATWWLTEDGAEQHVLPILVGAVDSPGPAAEFLNITAAADPKTAGDQVRQYLGLTPEAEPATTSRLFGMEQPGFPPHLSPVWQIGPRRPTARGNVDALIELERVLWDQRTGTKRVAVIGPRGAGKTWLANEYAHRQAIRYAGCWWLDASVPALLPVQIRALVKVRRAAGLRGVWLLVLADAPDADDIPVLPPGDWHVIVTSTKPPTGVDTVRLKTPTPEGSTESSHQLDRIIATVDQIRTTEPMAAMLLRLLSALGPAPVPITMLVAGADGATSDLASQLGSRSEIDELLTVLCRSGLARRTAETVIVRSVVRQAVLADGDEAVATGQARNVVTLAVLGYAVREVPAVDWLPLLPHAVTCLAVSAAVPSYTSLLDYLDGWEAGDLQRVPLASALEATAGVLHALDEPGLALGLAERRRALADDLNDPSDTARIRAAVHRASNLRLAGRLSDALVEIEQAERMATAPLDPDSASDRGLPFEPPYLLVEKAQILAALGDIDGGLRTLERMWTMAAAGGPQLPHDARSYRLVHAELLAAAGRFAEALKILDPYQTGPEPGDDREAGLCQMSMATLYLHLNQPAKARRHAEAAIDILSAVGDEGDLLHPLLNRATALHRLGEQTAALDDVNNVIALAEVHTDHTVLVQALALAADALANLNDIDQAIATHHQARAQAAEHDLPLAARVALDFRLADVYVSANKVDDAADLLKQTVSAIDRGSERVPVETRVDVLNLLVRVELERGQPAEALPLAEQAAQLVHNSTVPARHLGTVFYQLGTTLLDLGRPGEAIAVLQPALVGCDQATEDGGETDAAIRLALARVHREAGDAAGALKVIEEAAGPTGDEQPTHAALIAHLTLEHARALFGLGHRADGLRFVGDSVDYLAAAVGPQDPKLAHLLEVIGGFLLTVREPVSAARYVLRALDVARDLYGERSLQYATNLDNLGRARVALGDATGALGLNKAAVEITREILGADHPIVAVHLHNLGDALIQAGEARAAVPVLQEAIRIDTLAYGPNHSEVGHDLSTRRRATGCGPMGCGTRGG